LTFLNKVPGKVLIFLGALCLSFGGIIVKSFEGANEWQILFWRQFFFSITVIVYLITSLYALTWINNSQIISKKNWVNNLLLVFGGYLSGTSLMGGALLVAVYMRHIDIKKLRNTLFVLWFFLVSIKMAAFVTVGVNIDWRFSLMLIPVAALGHFVGLRVHDKIIENDTKFKRWMGSILILVCVIGLVKVFYS